MCRASLSLGKTSPIVDFLMINDEGDEDWLHKLWRFEMPLSRRIEIFERLCKKYCKELGIENKYEVLAILCKCGYGHVALSKDDWKALLKVAEKPD